MVKSLMGLVSKINLSEKTIPPSEFERYQARVELSASSDCCYGADCGDCTPGGDGYCIDSECV